jgi:hypothetical protein
MKRCTQIPRTVPHYGPEDAFVHSLPEPPDYWCYRVAEPLVIDGRLDDPSWKKAPWLGPFVDMGKGTPVRYDTRVAFLWDDEAFYCGFRCEEPDVFGYETVRDGGIGGGEDFEVFILGEGTYYELEMNPLNTLYEVFWWFVRPLVQQRDYARIDQLFRCQRFIYGGLGDEYDVRHGSFDWDFPGIQSAVHVDGSLNWHKDVDKGWSGEIVFPWAGWGDLAQGVRSIPPQDGDVWRVGCSRLEYGRDSEGRIAWGRDWSIARHGRVNMHLPGRWPYVIFSTDVVGTQEQA